MEKWPLTTKAGAHLRPEQPAPVDEPVVEITTEVPETVTATVDGFEGSLTVPMAASAQRFAMLLGSFLLVGGLALVAGFVAIWLFGANILGLGLATVVALVAIGINVHSIRAYQRNMTFVASEAAIRLGAHQFHPERVVGVSVVECHVVEGEAPETLMRVHLRFPKETIIWRTYHAPDTRWLGQQLEKLGEHASRRTASESRVPDALTQLQQPK